MIIYCVHSDNLVTSNIAIINGAKETPPQATQMIECWFTADTVVTEVTAQGVEFQFAISKSDLFSCRYTICSLCFTLEMLLTICSGGKQVS